MQNQRWVVKTNLLNGANSKLTTIESKLVNFALCETRRTGKGVSRQNPLHITAQMYADTLGVKVKNIYRDFKNIASALLDKVIYFTDPMNNQQIEEAWTTHIEYHSNEGALELVLSPFVLRNILNIDEESTPCTAYELSNIAKLKSQHAIRLYELLSQYKAIHKIPKQHIDNLKKSMNVSVNDSYHNTSDFNRYVLRKSAAELKEQLGVELNIDTNSFKKGFVEINILSMGSQSTRIIKKENHNKKEPHSIGHNPEKLTDQQVISFAYKLFYDEALKSRLIEPNETDLAFFQRLLKLLQDVDIVKELMPYLLNHEYKPD